MTPSAMAQKVRLRPRVTEPRSHLQLITTPAPSAAPAETIVDDPPAMAAAAPVVVLFNWADDQDRPPMPTLVACAADRLGQYLANPLTCTKAEAFEALRAVISPWHPGDLA